MNWLIPTARPVPEIVPTVEFPITVKERKESVSGKTNATPRRKPYQSKVKNVLHCPTCGNKFLQKTTWQTYCSSRCNDNRHTGRLIPVSVGALTFMEPAWRVKG